MKGELSERTPLVITHTTGRGAIYCIRGHWVVLLRCSAQALAQHLDQPRRWRDAGVPLALPPAAYESAGSNLKLITYKFQSNSCGRVGARPPRPVVF